MRGPISDEVNRPQNEPDNAGQGLLERAFARENLKRAWKRIKANKGAAGVDGLDIEQTAEHLLSQWATIREQLLSGVYRPSPVRRVVIPKPDGGRRELGILTVTDRLIQQALLQVLQPLLDPTFSEHSYGFRPGRCAQDVVLAAQRYVSLGRRVVVDAALGFDAAMAWVGDYHWPGLSTRVLSRDHEPLTVDCTILKRPGCPACGS